ncbi:MAG: ferritin-like domain-containing protein [Pseudomonadota bacterium]
MNAELVPSKENWRQLQARRAALPATERAALARHWALVAQLEHASVAAFSRFSLQLLAVGAPPSLLEDAHRAALDEIRHAELCFSLATVYAGKAIGPAPLPVSDHALGVWDLAGVAVGTVEEGCIGETIAALEAQRAAELAEDAAVRVALQRIHEDETRHAELAWRFVHWAVLTGDRTLRPLLEAAFERALERHVVNAPLEVIAEARLEAHGVLSSKTKRALRAKIASEVLRPSFAKLLRER